MSKVAIMTDSTACIPRELESKYDIAVVPLLIVFEGKSYRDGVDMSADEVYRIMRNTDKLPTTSVPSPVDFLEVYRRLGQKTESILCVALNSLQSKTFDAAVLAKEMAKEVIPNTAIEVIDSRITAGALGLVVLEAARVASHGADLAQVAEAARRMIPRVNLIAMLDTLYYLAKGGRIGKASAWTGSLLSLKPILEASTSTGNTEALDRPRTKAKAVKRLLEIMAERVGNSPVHVLVHHAGVPEEGEQLKAQVASRFDCAELYLTEFTPLMGAHTGPGVLALSFYAES